MAVVAVRLVLVPVSFELGFLSSDGGSKGSDDSILLGEFRFVGLKPGSRQNRNVAVPEKRPANFAQTPCLSIAYR